MITAQTLVVLVATILFVVTGVIWMFGILSGREMLKVKLALVATVAFPDVAPALFF